MENVSNGEYGGLIRDTMKIVALGRETYGAFTGKLLGDWPVDALSEGLRPYRYESLCDGDSSVSARDVRCID